jgi:hypothetical protein
MQLPQIIRQCTVLGARFDLHLATTNTSKCLVSKIISQRSRTVADLETPLVDLETAVLRGNTITPQYLTKW